MDRMWKQSILRDICERIDYGYTASATQEKVGPKFLRITDIVPKMIDWQSVPFCKIDNVDIPKYELKNGDIVIARTGATSGYAKHIRNQPKSVFASYLVRIRIKSDFNNRFIGIILESDQYKKFIKSNISGSAQPQANAKVLTSYPLRIPPRKIQEKIVAILSAYDDLIENNTRRIAILEEMAQSIYQEWFVHFRYPGHEKNKMLESELGMIPEGWNLTVVEKVFQIFGGGTPSTKEAEYWDQGDINWYSPSDLTSTGTMFIKESSKKITAKGLQESSAHMFPAYSVMMTSRATIGVAAINTLPACTNQGFIICVPNENLSTYQIYYWVIENREKISRLASGATFKEINRATFRQLPIFIPDIDVSRQFNKVVEPIFKQVKNLIERNTNLKRTRDMLLPKLISGEIDVEALDIEMPEVIEPEEQQDMPIVAQSEPVKATQLALPLL